MDETFNKRDEEATKLGILTFKGIRRRIREKREKRERDYRKAEEEAKEKYMARFYDKDGYLLYTYTSEGLHLYIDYEVSHFENGKDRILGHISDGTMLPDDGSERYFNPKSSNVDTFIITKL